MTSASMNTSHATLAGRTTSGGADARERVDGTRLAGVLVAILAPVFAWIAWQGAAGAYAPGSRFGYALGVTGTSMMAVLLLYPLRKHVRLVRNWVPLKHWFAMHMICGITGPLLVVLHSTFRMRSLNATVAMSSMILVALSGVVGRFLYRRIHRGLNDARAVSQDLQHALAGELAEAERVIQPLPAVKQELDRFAAVASQPQLRWRGRAFHFVTLGWKRLRAEHRIARALARVPAAPRSPARAQLASLRRTSRGALRAMQRVAQFAAYERLFSLWRILHVPFVFMLVVSAIVHVVAVHAY